jgi:hypothetical protein
MSRSTTRYSRSIQSLLHRRLNRTQYVYRATKLEAYIYEPFFTVESVTESGEAFENCGKGGMGGVMDGRCLDNTIPFDIQSCAILRCLLL